MLIQKDRDRSPRNWHISDWTINMDISAAVGATGSVAAAGVAAWAAYQSRSAAQEANAAAKTLADIERERRHAELCPNFRISSEPGPPGSEILRLHVALLGPPGLTHLDKLRVTIRDDHFGRGEAVLHGGLTADQVKQQIWGAYHFTPSTGSHGAVADPAGRTVPYEGRLPLGEELLFQIEHTLPPPWSQMSSLDWQRDRGTVIRLALDAEHSEHGMWRLPCEIDVGTGDDVVTVHAPG